MTGTANEIAAELRDVLLGLAPCIARPRDKRWIASVSETANGLHGAVQRIVAGEVPGDDLVWVTDISLDAGRINRGRVQMVVGPLAPREIERMAWLIRLQARLDGWLAECTATCSES